MGRTDSGARDPLSRIGNLQRQTHAFPRLWLRCGHIGGLQFLPIQTGRCQRLTLTEGSGAAPILVPMTPPSRITAPPPHLNGEGIEMCPLRSI